MKKRILSVFLALCLVLSGSVFAIELEKVESGVEADIANEDAIAEVELASASEAIAKYHSTYGELIWYNSFESSYSAPDYFNGGTSSSGSLEGSYGTLSLADSPSGEGKVLKVASKGSNSGYIISISNFVKNGAKITVRADIYQPSSSITRSNIWLRMNPNGDVNQDWGFDTEEAARDEWKTITYTVTMPSENAFSKVEIRNNTANGDVYYFDNVKIYALYTLDSDEIRLNDGAETEVVKIGEGTYTFPKCTESDVYFKVWSDGTNSYKSGQTVNSADIAGKVFTATDILVPEYDSAYGELVYYNGFEQSYTKPVYFNLGTGASGEVDGYAKAALAASPTGEGKSLKLTAIQESNQGFIAKISGFQKLGAKITMIADYYMPSATIKKGTPDIWVRLNGGNADWGFNEEQKVRDNWVTVTCTLSCDATVAFKQAEFRNSVLIDDIFYIDNVRIYASYVPSENEIRLVDGTEVKVVSLTEDKYVFPESGNDGVYYTMWKASDGTAFVAGAVADKADIVGKTFNAMNVTAPLVDEKYGMLAVFHGYDGTKYQEIEYFANDLFSNVTWSAGNGINFNNFAWVADKTDVKNKTLEMSLKSGASYKISGFQYTFTGFNLTPGTITQFLDVYNRNESSALHREMHINTDKGNLGIYGQWKDITFTPNAWTRNVEVEKYYIAKNSDSATNGTYAYKLGKDFTQGHTQIAGNVLSHLQFRFIDSGKTEVTTDNYRMYFYPSDGLVFKNGEELVMKRGAQDGTFTFPAVSEIFEDADNNAFWTDGNNVYVPGETVNVSSVAKKTFTPYAAYPETSNTIQIRLNGNKTTDNGIRFKAVMDGNDTDLADEWGFIVARSDKLATLGKELTFDLESKYYTTGVNYEKATGKNIIYDKNESTGDITFTAVCVGIDTTNKLQTTTALVARPYLKVKLGDKTVVVYGNAKSKSLAEAVSEIKTAAEAGDEQALAVYNENKEYIDIVLETSAG